MIGTGNFFRDGSKAGGFKALQREAIRMDARSNFKAGIAYDDLREWLVLAERLGEVRTVRGASWQEDIGLAAEAILRAADVDVTDLEHLLWAMLTRTDPKESIRFIEGSWDSPADPRLSPERRAAGDMTHSVAIINACRPYHWRDKFPPTDAPSAAVARKARERFGWLLDGLPQT
jgi:3-polyprenyl-4-hydroxybenzoate decarboxylase